MKGRPRKNQVDHSYEKSNENRKGWEVHVEAGQTQNNLETGDTLGTENKNQLSTTGNECVNISLFNK